VHTRELERPSTAPTPTNRCYYCKHELYSLSAGSRAARFDAIVDGSNADDRGDSGRGRAAARGVRRRSPLDEVG
jgi:uncharacterized protein